MLERIHHANGNYTDDKKPTSAFVPNTTKALHLSITEKISATQKYLESNAIHDHCNTNINEYFNKMLTDLQLVLNAAETDRTTFPQYESLANSTILFFMSGINYPVNATDFLIRMRHLMDDLNAYTNAIKPKPVYGAQSSYFFSHPAEIPRVNAESEQQHENAVRLP
jgi:hypothetical protein